MLKTTLMKGSGAAKRYFETLAENDGYYVKTGEEAGVWDNELNGNRLLGLEGRVERKAFGRLFDGYAPDGSKEKLVQSAGRKADPETGEGGHRPGWDFTFSAVKSFSLMYVRSDDPALKAEFRRAHDESVRETLTEIERHTMTRIRVDGKVVKVPAQMVAASFFHEAARGQDGQVPDPQVHSHVTVFNVTPRVVGTHPDGRPIVKSTALEPRNLYEMELRYGRMYRDKLEEKVHALGFETYKVKGQTPVQDAWEFSYVPKPLIRESSKRSVKIRSEARDESAEERDRVALRTRDKKQPKVHTKEACQAHWKEMAERHGFSVKNVPRWRQEKASPFEQVSLPAREQFWVKPDPEKAIHGRQLEQERVIYPEAVVRPKGESETRSRRPAEQHTGREVLTGFELYPDAPLSAEQPRAREAGTPVERPREGSQTRARQTEDRSRAKAEEPLVDKSSARMLRAARNEWEGKGYKVICCAWSAKKAKAIEAETSIKTQTIQKTVSQLQGIGMKRGIGRTHRQRARKLEEKGKVLKQTLREMYAEYKYSTWQWSGKTKKKYLGDYYQATSEAKHAFWYATHRISRSQMNYLNSQLRRQEFEITIDLKKKDL